MKMDYVALDLETTGLNPSRDRILAVSYTHLDVYKRQTVGRVINTDGMEVNQAVFVDITENKKLQLEQEKERLIENRSLRAAICTAYPVIMSVNLTQNTFDCFIEDNFIIQTIPSGNFDDLVAFTKCKVYSSYQADFAGVLSLSLIHIFYRSG